MPISERDPGETKVARLPLSAFRAELGDTKLRMLFDYWLGLNQADRLPPRKAIDPAAIMPILPDLYILERLADNGLRFRLVGTAVRDLFRHDVTGKRLDEALDGEYYRNAVRCYRLVNATRTPWLTRIVYDLGQGDRFTYRRLVCPLSADGEQPDSYVGAFETTDIYSPARLFIEVEHMVTAILERREAVLEAGWLG